MKHKYVSLLLCLAMVLGTFSPAAMAEEYAEDIAIESVMEEDLLAEDDEDSFGDIEEVEIADTVQEDELGSDFDEGLIEDVEEAEEDVEFVDTTPVDELKENEEEVAAAKAAAAIVTDLLRALPNPEDVTTDDRDQITYARQEYEKLSAVAKNDYVERNLVKKLEDCERMLEKIDSDEAKGHELARQIKALPDPADITLDDEPEIARLEGIRDSYTADELAQVGDENLQKLVACRDKITQLKAIIAVDDYVAQEIDPLIDSGEYDEEHQAEIDAIIQALKDKIKELTENGNPDGSPVTQEQIDALIQEAMDQIAQVKTVHQLAAEAYEEKLKAYKIPANLTLADKSKVEELVAEYEALSAKAKEILDKEYIKEGESYKSRLNALQKKISDLETELAKAKERAKDAYHHTGEIVPEYYTASGIDEKYYGIDAMINSGHYSKEGNNALKKIEDDTDDLIDDENLIDISKVEQYRDEAIAAAKKVRDTQRLQADAFEAKIDALGPVIDLSRNKADEVYAIRREYEALPSYAKKYIDTDKTAAGDTYKERIEALEARIDKMAQDDADAWKKLVDVLPYPSDATLANEGAIKNARLAYEALTKEAKKKVAASDLKKLTDLEAKMVLEHKKEDLTKEFNNYVTDKLAKTTYEDAGRKEVDQIAEETRNNIKNATSEDAARKAKEEGIRRIEAVKTKAQLLKERGIQTNFNRMRFRSTKQTDTQIFLRWKGVKGIDVFQIYGGKKNKSMKLLRQYDYKARSAKFANLYEKTEYRFKLYACKVVDGEIIKLYATPVIYATTTSGKYGTVRSVKINKVGNKDTSKEKHVISIKLKKGKKAKILKEEIITKNTKLKRRRKVKFESTNKKVATVSSRGVIKARKKGTCWIRAYSQSGKFRSVKVRVK